jgi:hypothetical protein
MKLIGYKETTAEAKENQRSDVWRASFLVLCEVHNLALSL